MDSVAESTRTRNRFEDLEHFDEPSPEDAADLDEQVWRHIESLLVGFDGPCDDEDQEDPGEPPPEVRGDDPDPVLEEVPEVGPVRAARPISGVLDQLALRFGESPSWEGGRDA